MKVVIGLALLAVVLGLGVHFGRSRVEGAVQHTIDTSMPSVVQQHAWAPVEHGRARAADRVVFDGGRIKTVRCHVDLGGYSLTVTHDFTFRPAHTHVKAHCPGVAMRHTLKGATRIDVSTDHRQVTLTGHGGDPVLVLRSR